MPSKNIASEIIRGKVITGVYSIAILVN
jgi:hypothetical protein